MKQARQGQLCGLAAALLFGCSAPLISTLTGRGSALRIAGLLYAGAALALLSVRVLKGVAHDKTAVQRRDAPALAGLIGLGGIVGPVALVLGLARLPAAASSLLLNLEAVFTLAIAVLVGREHLGQRGATAAALTIAGTVVLSDGSLSGANGMGVALIALATLAWGIDNNLSQRLSLRDPLQIASFKALGASLPMLLLALLLGHAFPPAPIALVLLLIGALGYGLSIWLDLLASRELGAAREAVIFSAAPFVGAVFSVAVLRDPLTLNLVVAAGLMGAGVVLLLREEHRHWHHHQALRHAHRHRHDPRAGDLHHEHDHSLQELEGIDADRPYWHAHEHSHPPTAHAHPHLSDVHHRHPH
jgi:drug/metabolite transporter (DMT)-like permease